MTKPEKTWSFKEIDEEVNAVKGTAFKAFKQLKDGLDEGLDFYYLANDEDASEIETLRSRNRIYISTINAVLLTQSGYAAVMEVLDDSD